MGIYMCRLRLQGSHVVGIMIVWVPLMGSADVDNWVVIEVS